jgi:hypothetical protein
MSRPLIAALLLLAPVSFAQGVEEPSSTPASPVVEAPPAPEAPPVPEAPPAAETPLSRVTLKDGQELVGRVVSHDTNGVVLEVAGGSRLTLSPESVARVEEARDVKLTEGGTVRFLDRGRTRYFFSNSALMLRGGEGFFSQRQLILSMVSLGVTDHLTVTVGSALPFWLSDTRTINFVGGVKVGGEWTKHFHVAVGLEAVALPIGRSAFGQGYVATTLGSPDAHLTLGLGVPLSVSTLRFEEPRFVIGTLGGTLRLTNRLALVTEHWALFGYMAEPQLLNSLGLRIIGERWGVDLGAMRVPTVAIPVPWLNFSWHWS